MLLAETYQVINRHIHSTSGELFQSAGKYGVSPPKVCCTCLLSVLELQFLSCHTFAIQQSVHATNSQGLSCPSYKNSLFNSGATTFFVLVYVASPIFNDLQHCLWRIRTTLAFEPQRHPCVYHLMTFLHTLFKVYRRSTLLIIFNP